jgi:Rrf2 family protein
MPLLSDKTIMAIGAVVDIAFANRPVSSRDLAKRLHLPGRRLEPALQALVREGILQGVRGPNGGYQLAAPRQLISIHRIIKVVSAMEAAERAGQAAWLLNNVIVPSMWQAEEQFLSTLKRITVEDLVRTASLNTTGLDRPCS